jgi:hypothetical protein
LLILFPFSEDPRAQIQAPGRPVFLQASHPAWGAENGLFPDPQLLDDAPVTFHILLLHVVEKSTPLTDQLQESPPGMMIFLVCLEVLRQILDARRQQGNLNLRGARVVFVDLKLSDYSLSFLRI